MTSLIFWFIASIVNGAMDMNFNMYDRSVFSKLKGTFWNPSESWKNKWKNGDRSQGERFWGSSTVFVSLTDSWHLFKGIFLLSILLTVFFYSRLTKLDIIIYPIVWFIGFESTLKLLKK